MFKLQKIKKVPADVEIEFRSDDPKTWDLSFYEEGDLIATIETDCYVVYRVVKK